MGTCPFGTMPSVSIPALSVCIDRDVYDRLGRPGAGLRGMFILCILPMCMLDAGWAVVLDGFRAA